MPDLSTNNLIPILPVNTITPQTPSTVIPIGVLGTSEITVPNTCGSSENSLRIGNSTPCTTTIVPSLDLSDTNFYQNFIDDGVVTVYIIESDYFWDQHVLQMPIMSTEVTACSFANLANQTLKRVCYWSAEKANSAPAMPDPDLNGDNSTLLEKRFTPMSIDLAADGVTKIYTLKGMYVYGINDPDEETMYYGIPPYIDDDYSTTSFGNYQHGIIDSLA